MKNERALVIGGGGVAGIAWATGVLAGLAEARIDVTEADAMFGTSAGATVAAQLTSGVELPALFQAQVDPALQQEELTPRDGALVSAFEFGAKVDAEVADPVERLRRIGEMALAAETVTEAERRAVIEARLPSHRWPERSLSVVAVHALTGETRVFDRTSGAGLVDAVTASCAVPGVWPAATVGDERYIDGGTRSLTNLDLAAGFARTLVIAPIPDPVLDADAASIAERGGLVEIITPDEAGLAAFGTDPLSPASRTPAGHAGVAQGRAAAQKVSALWHQA
ncbi:MULTISPECIES: patatin-like phospholipase family protein [unclassified Streptomyces]|uniref:patatin-like phospholipase family protein n=1 Tax=unclassified Streptomyces TaxID=2593676 RepID=UPI0003751C3B|nr:MULTISPECIES: patatin-like phospholipase family protein [unclassified Streptomyces]MYT30260.1 patatin-like phospholipase family protein [Streptomyces sp. SID8354]